jgi:hypothetical protein
MRDLPVAVLGRGVAMTTTPIPANMQRFADFMAANPSPVNCVIGRYYNLPCINLGSKASHHSFWGEWVPLIGPPHQDKEIVNFPYWHIHTDTRFLTLDDSYRSSYASGAPVCFGGPSPYLDKVYEDLINNSTLQVKRLQCRRAKPLAFPFAPWRKELQNAYADSHAVDGICPHRGIAIACGHRLAPGLRQCPGHGLVWSEDGYQCQLVGLGLEP